MKLHELFESDERRVSMHPAGMPQIHNPTILDVEEGNMVRVKEPGREEWGQMVIRVDPERQLVLVRDNIGGTLQRDEWTHVDNIHVTWNIGGRERAEELMGQLKGEVERVLDKREERKAERPPTRKTVH